MTALAKLNPFLTLAASAEAAEAATCLEADGEALEAFFCIFSASESPFPGGFLNFIPLMYSMSSSFVLKMKSSLVSGRSLRNLSLLALVSNSTVPQAMPSLL